VDTNGHLSLWDINTQQQVLSLDTTTADHSDTFQTMGTIIPLPKVQWDPHSNGHTIAVTVPAPNQKHINMISIFDVRCTKENVSTSSNHNTSSSSSSSVMEIGSTIGRSGQWYHPSHYGILDIDYNPNRPYMIGTACRNGTCQFYDLRYLPTTTTTDRSYRPMAPVCVARGGHGHYCTSIRYNPFHDQLVVSTGTDHISNLWRISSCSSAPSIVLPTTTTSSTSTTLLPVTDTLHVDDEDDYNITTTNNNSTTMTNIDMATNVGVQQYEYSDAVYTTSWGANDAWIYLTISYSDGKAVLQHVPSTEKYKILL
jgi:hypothetical protein